MTPLLSRKEDYEVRLRTRSALIMSPGEPGLPEESPAGAWARPGPRTRREGGWRSSSIPGRGVQRGPGSMCPHDHPHLGPHHLRLPPPLPPVRGEGGPGVRESRHLQTGPAAVRRSPGAGSLLHHSLCGCLREDWYENSDVWRSATRSKSGMFNGKSG